MPALSLAVRPDAVAVITIDQPDSRVNVMTVDLVAEFEAVVASLAQRQQLRGLIITSAKPGIFVAGADIKVFANAGPNDPAVRSFIDRGNRLLFAIESLPFLTVALIDGAALGGGLELALACDFRVCGPNPKVQLGLPETKLGLIPGWGGTQRLPRVFGMDRAAKMLASGEGLAATEAARQIGFVSTIVHGDNLVDETVEWLDALIATYESYSVQFARSLWEIKTERRRTKAASVPDKQRAAYSFTLPTNASIAVQEACRVMEQGASLPMNEAMLLETESFMRLAGSEESKRLIAAYFASRKS